MEVMGGAPFMDGEWESICKILSFDQDSDIANSVSHSVALLMGNSDSTSTSQCEMSPPFNCTNQHFLPTPFPHNLSQLSCISDLSNGLKNGSIVNANEVQTSANIDEDDQISSLTSSSSSSLGFLACDAFLMNRLINEPSIGSMKRKHEQLEIQAEIPASKKRSCAIDNRKMRPRKSKNEASQEEEQKWSSDTSDNESNGSHEVINEENSKLKGKKRVNKGAATDPQSLYARKRRERINERLRTLQKLVPNGTKVDISTMLEEAVTYIKFLQLQIKLLSSDDMWMYAPLAYNGFDVGHYNNFSLQLPRP